MIEQRKSTRYQSFAKANIEGAGAGEILLKDISVTGCRVECTTYMEVKLNQQYKLEIVPEKAANLGPFELHVESKWIRIGNYFYEIGFVITKSPKRKQFQRYVDYLSWRYDQGISMTGNELSKEPPQI